MSGVRDLLTQTRTLLRETVSLLKESMTQGIAPTTTTDEENASTTNTDRIEITQ